MINVVELLSREDCEKVLAELEKFQFTSGKNSATGRAKEVKDNFQLESTRSDCAYIFDGIKRVLDNHSFLKTHIAQVAYPRLFANYYSGGHSYGWHVDQAIINGMRTDYSFTICLKDPDSYEGGILQMKMHDNSIQGYKLPQGHMVIYPTGQLHRVTEVTSGSRVSIVGWMQSIFPDLEDRLLQTEYIELFRFLRDDCKLDWDDLNRFSQFQQKLIRRLLK